MNNKDTIALANRATAVLAKSKELGLRNRKGEPISLSEAYEIVAAEEGFACQQDLFDSLKKVKRFRSALFSRFKKKKPSSVKKKAINVVKGNAVFKEDPESGVIDLRFK